MPFLRAISGGRRVNWGFGRFGAAAVFPQSVRLGTTIFLLVFSVGCGFKPSSALTDVYFDGQLFVREGRKILRFDCSGSPIIDREHCESGRTPAWYADVQSKLFDRYGSGIEWLQMQVVDTEVMLERVDHRLLELIQVTPIGVDPDLEQRLDQLEGALIDARAKQAAVADQITRIQAALARSEDFELRQQLTSLSEQAAKLSSGVLIAQRALAGARDEYIRQHGDLAGTVDWDVLQNQRAGILSDLGKLQSRLDTKIKNRIAATQILRFISDEGFAFDFSRQTDPVFNEVVRGLVIVFREAAAKFSEEWIREVPNFPVGDGPNPNPAPNGWVDISTTESGQWTTCERRPDRCVVYGSGMWWAPNTDNLQLNSFSEAVEYCRNSNHAGLTWSMAGEHTVSKLRIFARGSVHSPKTDPFWLSHDIRYIWSTMIYRNTLYDTFFDMVVGGPHGAPLTVRTATYMCVRSGMRQVPEPE